MDSQNNVVALRRKLKFAPKAPPLRKSKPKLKTKVVDNDDLVEARDLLRRFNENSMKARLKVELHKLLLEIGEVAESKTYDENSSNPTMKLSLLEENPEKSMFLIQLPATLPIIKGSTENVLIDDIRLDDIPNVVTYNTLINAYCRFVSFDVGINSDVISYNSLISSAARKCLLSESFNLFDEMLQRGIHLHLGKPNEANHIFMDIVLWEFRPSPATYNVMINRLCKNGFITQILLMDFASLEEWVQQGRFISASKILGIFVTS
ncbi:hypothetical protein Lal_00022855 [Lupinus albus]|nr:hypothetical protein Lal_00022855 [Lupinus albus]